MQQVQSVENVITAEYTVEEYIDSEKNSDVIEVYSQKPTSNFVKSDCIAKGNSLGLEYWEYIMQKLAGEITDVEYGLIAEKLVKTSQTSDTKEIETILSWCYIKLIKINF